MVYEMVYEMAKQATLTVIKYLKFMWKSVIIKLETKLNYSIYQIEINAM